MKYTIYKLSFLSAVHFGKGSLEDGEYIFMADTLFSALCQEAYKLGHNWLQHLYERTQQGNIVFSDAFPYMNDTYYLPKPMKRIKKDSETSNSILKKAYKKLKYIPIESFQQYLQGDYDVLQAKDMSELGYFELKVSASINEEEEAKPYRIGQYFFQKNCGLYILVGYETENDLQMVNKLLNHLSYSGIGGKKSSGCGRFQLSSAEVPAILERKLNNTGNTYMTLSLSLPQEDELREVMEGAEYSLCKRSGFVDSETYAKEHHRKKDLYAFKAGACFKKKFIGDIYDVSHVYGKHAVYRYAKPLFMEVDA